MLKHPLKTAVPDEVRNFIKAHIMPGRVVVPYHSITSLQFEKISSKKT